jgi:hypothetical protein
VLLDPEPSLARLSDLLKGVTFFSVAGRGVDGMI